MSYIKREENRIEIGNSFISRSFKISDNHFLPEKVVNKRIENTLAFVPSKGSEEFVVAFLGSFNRKLEVKASKLIIDKINEFEKDGDALIEFEFKPYSIKKAELKFRIIYILLENSTYIKKQLYIGAKGKLDLKIDCIDTESLVLGDSIVQKWSRPDMKKAFLDGFYSSLGQPVYINSMFVGSEFPLNDNNIVNSKLRLRYYCGKSLKEMLDGKEELMLHKSVFGAAQSTEYEIIRADFLKYIEGISQKTELRTQYNSWYDHMLDISEENITASFCEIEKGLTSHGVAPLDAYVVDDGWNDYESDFWCFNSKFPNELYNSSDLCKKLSSSFGLWLGPRGGYNYQTQFAKRMEKSKKGGYNKRSRDICISDKNYLNNVQQLFTDYINRFDISYFKLDGFMLKPCKSKKHGHPVGGFKNMYTLTDAWEKWLKLIENMREQKKELWINLTCYAVPSPWFLKWVNSVWMQNSDDIGFLDKASSGEPLNGSDFDKMLTYRDSLYYDFHNVRMYQFPNSNIYNHEPIYGNTAKISMTDDEYRKYMYMLSSRGTAFWELYYSYNLFNKNKWLINADVLNFVKENYAILKNSRLFGKSAETGKIYGYSAWNEDGGIVSFRNPSDKKQKYSLLLDRKIGVPEGIKDLAGVCIIPYGTALNKKPYSFGDAFEVELDAHEIAVYKFSKPDTNAPKLLSAKLISNCDIELVFDKHILIDKDSFRANELDLTCELQADYSTVILKADKKITEAQLNISYSVKDLYLNVCEGTECVNNYPDGIITASKDKPCDINGDFTLVMLINSTVKDAMIFSQGNALAVSLSNGRVRFNCCSLKAVSDKAACDGEDKQLTLVRERNGMIKIYIDGVLSGSAYDERICNPKIACAPIKQSDSVKSFTFRDKALAFDEV